jgi:SAM-dependent methyltransferase
MSCLGKMESISILDPRPVAAEGQMIGDPNSAARYFRSRFGHEAQRSGVWRVICEYLEPFIPLEGCVLDLGAGYCTFINHTPAAEKHALDIFPGFATFAHADVHTHVGSCDDLSMFPSLYFDVVFASNLLEHLTAKALGDTLSEVRRVLKPSGYFVLVQPNFRYCYREYFDDYTHIHVFTHVGVIDLLASNGFAVERVEPRFLPLSFKSRLPKWPWIVKLYLRLPIRPYAKQMLVIGRVQA